MSLSVNDFKSFVKMKAEDKRRIIDKVFGLAIINKMRETLKLELKEVKRKSDTLKIQIRSLTDELARITHKLDSLNVEIKENNEQRKEEIQKALLKAKAFYKKLLSKEKEIIALVREREEIRDSLDKKISKISKVIYSYK